MSCCDETQSEFIKMFRGYQCHVVTAINVDLLKKCSGLAMSW